MGAEPQPSCPGAALSLTPHPGLWILHLVGNISPLWVSWMVARGEICIVCRGCGDRLRWRRDAGPHLVPWRVHGSAAVRLPGQSGALRPQEPQTPALCALGYLRLVRARHRGAGLASMVGNGSPGPWRREVNSQQHQEAQEGPPWEKPLPLCLPLSFLCQTLCPESLDFCLLYLQCLSFIQPICLCLIRFSRLASSSPLFPLPTFFSSSFFSLSPSHLPWLPALPTHHADAHRVSTSHSPCRASTTTGCEWCHAPGLGPLPGGLRSCSTPRRAGPT